VTGRPRVTIHAAQTLDGRIATRGGESQWISGDETLELAHRLRATHAAVLVGIGTVLADNPTLTTRLVDGPSPVRVILDSGLRLPPTAKVLTDRTAPTIVVTTPRAAAHRVASIRQLGAEVVVLDPGTADRPDLGQVIDMLGERDLSSILIEGGATVITSALGERLVDRVVLCIAPMICGSGVDTVGDLGLDRLAQALKFRLSTFYPVGRDVVFDGWIG
jgi:5-amino-6-(5-phosphoribosylamino)uracil reductase/diaminohydroxyphosphoribosylaminopyrimidine deaminase/5-amino-6-(5-phosphoribosylamino)uracil reductase